MTANTNPIFGLAPKTAGLNIVNATGTTKTTIFTAGANGSRVLSINAATDDTSANDVNLHLQPGGSGTVYNLGGKRVAIASGNVVASTIPAVNLLDRAQIPAILTDGSLLLGPGDVLQIGVVAAVTSGKTLTVVLTAMDY